MKKKALCLVKKGDTMAYKNWCNEPLENLLKKGDDFCTNYDKDLFINYQQNDIEAIIDLSATKPFLHNKTADTKIFLD